MIKSLLSTAVVLAGLSATPALAQASGSTTLNVQGVVAPYCNVRLANVSSGTASVAMGPEQELANLEIACNQSSGTSFTVTGTNGDLLNGAAPGPNNRINYSFRIESPEDSAFVVAPTDFSPSLNSTNKQRPGYSQAVANGVDLKMFLNVNRNNEGGQPDQNGPNQLPANNAPAGTYSEVFTFQVSAI